MSDTGVVFIAMAFITMEHHYKLRSSTLGLAEQAGKRDFVTIPAGSVICADVDLLRQDESAKAGMVEVEWEARRISIFLADLQDRAEVLNTLLKPEPAEPIRRDRLSDLGVGGYSSGLISRSEVGRILIDELNRTRTSYEEARKDFQKLVADVPSGLPAPDGSMRIAGAGQRNAAALSSYIRAFQELDAFTKSGAIPKRLEKSPQSLTGGATPE